MSEPTHSLAASRFEPAARSERLRGPATALVLFALGAFLYSRLTNGTLVYYIHARFTALTLVAALGLLAVGATYASRLVPALRSATDDADEPHHDHTSWSALFLIALPIVLGLAVEPRPLGASAMGGRDLSLGGAALSPARAAIERRLAMPAGERTILDWLVAFASSPDPASHRGQAAKVLGFVYRDERTPDDMFLISRFTIRCCVADGAAVWLPVRWPEAPTLDNDTWLEVEGVFGVGSLLGHDVPVLEASRVTVVEPPDQPYLYP